MALLSAAEHPSIPGVGLPASRGSVASGSAPAEVPTPVSSHLIETLYEAALSPETWQRAVDDLAAALGAAAFLVSVRADDSVETALLASGVDGPLVETYRVEYAGRDPWSSVFDSVADFAACIGDRLVDVSELQTGEFYLRWMRAQQLDPRGVCVGHAVRGAMRVDVRVFHRKVDPRLLRRNLIRLTALLPHMGRAFEIDHRLDRARQGCGMMREALDRIPIGVLLVDPDGQVLGTNRSAEASLAGGGILRIEEGSLRLMSSRDNTRLRKILGSLSRTGTALSFTSLPIVRRPHQGPVSLVVCQLSDNQSWWSNGPVAAIFISDLERRLSIHTDVLRQLYGFSQIQAEVAGQLMKGMTLKEIAAARGVRRSTIRSHVDQLYARTNTRRQTELVHFLLSSPARLLIDQRESLVPVQRT